jgi:hypothetical protein
VGNYVEAKRELLQDTVERDEQEFLAAVRDLKEAVRRPFRLSDRFARNPLPWLVGAMLLGFYAASGGNNGDGE